MQFLMPLVISCEQEHGFEKYLPLRGDPNPPCEVCQGPTERVWSLGSHHVGSSTFPYVTKNITGKPIEIKSASHLEQVCKQYGVTHRDDEAWVEKRFENGKYIESSGQGMKRTWF